MKFFTEVLTKSGGNMTKYPNGRLESLENDKTVRESEWLEAGKR